jgi:mRNA interferase MazF
VVVRRGEVWWAELREPRGSEPGYTRPVLIVQSDAFNQSRINTVIAVTITSNTKLADAPGNVLLPRKTSGLPKPSVANISQLVTLDRAFLTRRVKMLAERELRKVEAGLRLVFALQ